MMRQSLAWSWAGALAAASAGCSGPAVDRPSLRAEARAEAFSSRSLSDPALRAYVREHLGRDPGGWDFEGLCWAALYSHPSLALARAQSGTAAAAVQTATQRPNPNITLTPGYDFTHQAGISPWMPSVSLDWLIQTGGKRQHQLEAAEANAVVAQLSVTSAAWQVRSDLRKALTDVWAAKRRAEAQEIQVQAQRRLVQLLEQRFQAGAIGSAEVAASRTLLLRSEAAAADAATQAVLARGRVAASIGLPQSGLAGVRLPAPVPPSVPSDEQFRALRAEALRTRADILGALAKYASAQAALEVEVARRIPDVHFGPAYQWDQGLSKWSLGLTFEIPLFNRNQGPIAEAIARRAEAAAQFDSVQAQAAAAIDGARLALDAAIAQERRARALQGGVAHQRDLAAQRRQAGAADAVEEEGAEIDAATAYAAAQEAQLAVVAAASDLEAALQLPSSHFIPQ